MNISGNTGICAIIGYPVGHTVSPAMHNAAFKEMGLDYLYVPFQVNEGALKEAVCGLKALNVAGFNVTIPHKVKIMPLLDKLDPLAERIGAVNTVMNKDGKLWGYNTDAPGFLRALRESGFKPEGKKIMILGAGGAARAVGYILAENGAELTILNRSGVAEWAGNLGNKARVMSLNRLGEALDDVDLLVNAAGVGMRPDVDSSLVPPELLARVPLVFDIVYNPVQTRLLKDAGVAGAKIINGVEMLVWQGALAFELWTGKKAPVEIMRREALRMLG